ncbi:hypothetical protein NM208_g17115 [Fusarium decemcellulare]|uniref:Uncharacterized protein n=1 Tax=Fusarium decemcellulare TaxID=57161 RepID=A0ACC1R9M7_9HYPO|nr:hypothetical protein NM208_g17115 [Fusarium decemcellulare]
MDHNIDPPTMDHSMDLPTIADNIDPLIMDPLTTDTSTIDHNIDAGSMGSTPTVKATPKALILCPTAETRNKLVSTLSDLERELGTNPPQCLLLPDPCILTHQKPNPYVPPINKFTHEGGTVLVLASFVAPSFFDNPESCTPPPEQRYSKFFLDVAGLLWEVGEFTKYDIYLSPRLETQGETQGTGHLLPRYEFNGLVLSVVRVQDAWYFPGYATIPDFADPTPKWTDTPIALASVERGQFGFVGDVAMERGSSLAALVMCGLLE